MTWVLDASAVICWLYDEPGTQRVEDVLTGSEPLLMHAVNLVEVQYVALRRDPRGPRIVLEHLRMAGVEIVRVLDDDLLTTAVRLKASYAPIALGDAFAAGLAIQRSATLLTTDRSELEKLADAGLCNIEFLR